MSVLTPIEGVEEKELTPYPEIEFDVVMEASLEKFKRKVNLMLGQGWQTEGGMNAVAVGNGVRFYQSMIRWNVDKSLDISGLENEPDLYEDVEKDAQHNNVTRPENLGNVGQPVGKKSEIQGAEK